MGFSDLGCYGGEIASPHLDRLAEGGVRFTNFVNTGKCWSSRVSLLTGRYYPESTIHGPERNSVTIAEVLGAEGYQTWAVGKWHQRAHPMDAGFQKFVGHLNRPVPPRLKGSDSFYIDREPYTDFPEGWWAPEFYADHIIEKIRGRDQEKPFFLYFAADTPHWPFQAQKEDTEQYLDVYNVGWDHLRKQRWKRQNAMGLTEPGWSLPPRPDDVEPSHFWRMPQEEVDAHVMAMAGFAGSITGLDRQLARVVQELETQGLLENTLILFLSDNGACDRNFTREETRKNLTPPWDPESFWACGPEWAHLSNTPFRRYKNDVHEGGAASPLVVHWPAAIPENLQGGFIRGRSHIVDILSTCLDAADVAYPNTFAGQQVGEPRGVSFLPALRGEPWIAKNEHWYAKGLSQALVQWPWKIVTPEGGGLFSLYNLETDRAETLDLKHQMPQLFYQMRSRYHEIDQKLNQSATDKNFVKFRDTEP
jgi:arylsulfatase